MIKIRTLAAVILVAAVLALGVVPLTAPTAEAAPVPMLCFLTVYECDTDPGLVGAGYNVTAYIAATTGGLVRAEGLTDANGEVELQVWPSDPELTAHRAVTFKVDGLTATADPAITATLAPQTSRLDFCDGGGGPCTWVFPHGLDVDPLAVFPRYYDCSTVTLGSLDPENPAEIPAELEIVWHYYEATPVWQYFIPGSGGSLTTLVAGNVYLMVVESDCTWDIPQP